MSSPVLTIAAIRSGATTAVSARRNLAAPTPPATTATSSSLTVGGPPRDRPSVQRSTVAAAVAAHEKRARLAGRRRSAGAGSVVGGHPHRAPRRGHRRRRAAPARRRRRRPPGSIRPGWRRRAARPAGPRAAGTRTPRRATGRRATVAAPSNHALAPASTAPGRCTRACTGGGRAAMAAVTAGLSSPSAPASTRARSGTPAAAAAERRPRAPGGSCAARSCPRASANGRPSRAVAHDGRRAGSGDGGGGPRWTTSTRSAPSSSRVRSAVAWLDATTTAPDADAAPQHRRRPAHRRRGQVGAEQEPHVVHRHQPRAPARWDDVVGAVHHVDVAEEPVDPRVVEPAPQPMGGRGREREAAGRRVGPGPEAQQVRRQLDVVDVAEGGGELADGDTDAGATAVEGPDIEGDADRGHRGPQPIPPRSRTDRTGTVGR